MNQLEHSVQGLLDLNRRHSDLYLAQTKEREEYIRQHPTTVVAFQCMDGRINLPVITGSLPGIMVQYRNIGGKFDIGWHALSDNLRAIRRTVKSANAQVLVLATYHFSVGSVERGCAGFGHDQQASFNWMVRFRNQIRKCHAPHVYPIILGIETDSNSLILHGTNERNSISLSNVADKSSAGLAHTIRTLCPDMPPQVVLDLLPLLLGNLAHMGSVTGRQPGELVHREWVLGVGSGFDWMHLPNTAIIVGPRSPEMQASILTAANIIASNFEEGRVERSKFVVLASAVAEDEDDRMAAQERANYLGHKTRNIIRDHLPKYAPLMHRIHVVVDQWTRRMHVVFEQQKVKEKVQESAELRVH